MDINQNGEFTVDYSKRFLLIFGALPASFLFFFSLLSIITSLLTEKSDVFYSLLSFVQFVIIAVAIFWFIKSYNVTVKYGKLIYHRPFRKPKEINISEIESAEVQSYSSHLFQPYVHLVIYPKEISGNESIVINLRTLEKRGIQKLLDILPLKDGAFKNVNDILMLKYFN